MTDVFYVNRPSELQKYLILGMRKIRKNLEENKNTKQKGIMIWGGIGISKSDQVIQATKVVYGEDANIVDFRLGSKDLVALTGIPNIDKDKNATVFNPPLELPREGKGVIFLDEINLAPISIQHTAYSLIYDRFVGNYKVPNTYQIVACANKREHKAGVYEMPAPLLNRLLHIELLEPSEENGNLVEWTEDWTNWAVNNGIDVRIITYINRYPMRLYTFNKDRTERAFATPRSWEYTSRFIKDENDYDTLKFFISANCGQGIAEEFIAFLKLSEEIDIDKILDNPDKLKWDDLNINKKYAFNLSLTSTVMRDYEKKKDKNLITNFIKIVNKMDVEFQVLALKLIKSSKTITEDLIKSKEFRELISDNLLKYLR